MEELQGLSKRAFAFTLRIASLCNTLRERNTYAPAVEVVFKSGTAVGVSIDQATHKMGIGKTESIAAALDSAYQTLYWFRFMRDTNLLLAHEAEDYTADLESIVVALEQMRCNTIRH